MVGGSWLFDTTRALYVWEHPFYPQYHIPDEDVDHDLLVDEDELVSNGRGRHAVHAIRAAGEHRRGAARRVVQADVPGILNTWRFEWGAVDQWFEEDEPIFVHPRSPYVRVDTIASSRAVRIEVAGAVLASATWSIHLFETALPTRYYLARTAVDWSHLSTSETVSSCPYKGTAGRYWNAVVGDTVLADVAWSYDFPTQQAQPIAGLVAFDDTAVEVIIQGGSRATGFAARS
jgi:uncharacterized protein (DUF427 family)